MIILGFFFFLADSIALIWTLISFVGSLIAGNLKSSSGTVIFDNEDNSLVHVSDNGGYMDRVLLEKLHNHTYYLIESNYDEYMQIIDTTRNEKLKRRVLGAWGHTSNVQAMSNFFKLVGERTKGLMFTHLSEHCNSLDIAKNTHDNLIDIWGKNRELKNVTIKYANQSNSTEM